MNVLGVIPARYDSSRFPGKPLALIAGKPMIEHVYRGSRESTKISDLIVATDDHRILEAVQAFGGQAMMTGKHHTSGTSRCIEVASRYPGADWVINIQGDEPLINGLLLDQVIDNIILKPQASIVTMVRTITNEALVHNPNVVKCVLDREGKAMYFSRSPIPYYRSPIEKTYFQHIGVYAYKSSILTALANLQMTPLESAESLEQLRWLEHGLAIYAGITTYEAHGVDSPEDVGAIERMLAIR